MDDQSKNSHALNNGLARTPPMGWLSWARFYCQVDCTHHPLTCINEQLYTDHADSMVSEGYLQLGYKYLGVDDCWMSMTRDAAGNLQANATRFPHGIKWLADYVHDRGLKFQIYEDYGTKTCEGYPGSLLHLQQDANTFAKWGVDSLKLDGCYSDVKTMPQGYQKMLEYLNKTRRPIMYSCSWPTYWNNAHMKPDYQLAAKQCNLWRNFNDINSSWKSIKSVIDYYDHHQDELIPAAGPGHWNDPDMLVIGNPGVTVDQAKVQMAIWSIWSAPLLMSNDLRFMQAVFKEILQNQRIIAVDQDPLGIMGRMVANTTYIRVYVKPMTPVNSVDHHSYAVAFLNVHERQVASVSVVLSKTGLVNPMGYFVQDLYSGEQHGLMYPKDEFSCTVNPTGVKMVKATVSDKF